MSQPTNIANPGAVQQYGTGAPAGGGDGQAPPVDCCETDETNVPDRTDGRAPISLSTPEDVDLVQSKSEVSGVIGPTVTATLDDPVTAGRTLVAVMTERGGSPLATPTGYTRVGEVEKSGFGGGLITVWYKVSDGSDGSLTVTKTSGSTSASLTLMEFSGVGAFTDFAVTPTTGDSGSVNVGPVDVDEDGSLAVLVGIQVGVPVTHSATGYTLVASDSHNGLDPTYSVFWGLVDTPDETATITSTYSGGAWAAFILTFEPATVDSTWNVLEPRVTDDDDATYEDVDGALHGGEHLRFDLGAAFTITRMRARLGTTTAGSKTLTLYAWNELDQSDIVTLNTVTFTGLGSLTAQEVTDSWLPAGAYRYLQLDGPSEVIRWFTVQFFEPTLGQSHSHGADLIDYDNTDSGLTADNVQDAIDELVDALSGGAIWRPVMAQDPADTDHWYVVVDGDGTAVMAQ